MPNTKPSSANGQIQVGNAPCSWGTLEIPGVVGERVEYVQMLDELAASGYTGTELGDWGFMPTEPRVLKQELDKRRLAMLGAFVAVPFKLLSEHEDGITRAVETAKLLAAVSTTQKHKPFVVLADDNGSDPLRTKFAGRVTPDMSLQSRDWKVFAQGVERVARAVRAETGLPCVFHHHCGGYVETPTEIAKLLELTDPSLVGLVFDTGHYVYGSGTSDGKLAEEGLERFKDRIRYVHFKDCEPNVAHRARVEGWECNTAVRHGVFCELGKGCVDFPAILKWLRARDYQGWVLVEQDVLPGMGAPAASAAE